MATIELQGTYGGDETHALAAWTSTVRELVPEKIDRIPQLLKFLADNKHTSPFEKSFIHFLCKDIDTASHIHLLKHRIGVSVNGESARYREVNTRHHVPTDWPEEWKTTLRLHAEVGEELYHEAIEFLVVDHGFDRKRAKESARFFLTYANELTLDVSFNFNSFMHFISKRHEPDAQKEIYDIAEQMLNLVGNTKKFDDSLRAYGLGEYAK